MEVVEQSASRLVLRERPWLESVVGTLFVVAGTVFFLRETGSDRWLTLLFIAIGLGLLLYVAQVVTCVFDRGSNQLVREARGVLRSSRRSVVLSEIERVRVVRRNGSKGPTYSVELGLVSGKPVPLPTGSSSGVEPKQRVARLLREFLQLPPDPTADGDAPSFGEVMSILRGKDEGVRQPPQR
jgi:hypothetical protein